MFHASFMTIPTCFVHTLYHFYAFYGTNLLTRCRSANSCFLLFLVPEILHRKYSRNWTKQKPNFLFSSEGSRTSKESRRRPAGDPHHRGARAHPWPRRHVVWAPPGSSEAALPPIYSLRLENPKTSSHIPRRVP